MKAELAESKESIASLKTENANLHYCSIYGKFSLFLLVVFLVLVFGFGIVIGFVAIELWMLEDVELGCYEVVVGIGRGYLAELVVEDMGCGRGGVCLAHLDTEEEGLHDALGNLVAHVLVRDVLGEATQAGGLVCEGLNCWGCATTRQAVMKAMASACVGSA